MSDLPSQQLYEPPQVLRSLTYLGAVLASAVTFMLMMTIIFKSISSSTVSLLILTIGYWICLWGGLAAIKGKHNGKVLMRRGCILTITTTALWFWCMSNNTLSGQSQQDFAQKFNFFTLLAGSFILLAYPATLLSFTFRKDVRQYLNIINVYEEEASDND